MCAQCTHNSNGDATPGCSFLCAVYNNHTEHKEPPNRLHAGAETSREAAFFSPTTPMKSVNCTQIVRPVARSHACICAGSANKSKSYDYDLVFMPPIINMSARRPPPGDGARARARAVIQYFQIFPLKCIRDALTRCLYLFPGGRTVCVCARARDCQKFVFSMLLVESGGLQLGSRTELFRFGCNRTAVEVVLRCIIHVVTDFRSVRSDGDRSRTCLWKSCRWSACGLCISYPLAVHAARQQDHPIQVGNLNVSGKLRTAQLALFDECAGEHKAIREHTRTHLFVPI